MIGQYMNEISGQNEKQCSDCNMGELKEDEEQFCVDRGNKIMFIGSVPAMVCDVCRRKEFDPTLSEELTQIADAIFAKSSCYMYAYNFSDLIQAAGAA
jgi:hypothetical protein